MHPGKLSIWLSIYGNTNGYHVESFSFIMCYSAFLIGQFRQNMSFLFRSLLAIWFLLNTALQGSRVKRKDIIVNMQIQNGVHMPTLLGKDF